MQEADEVTYTVVEKSMIGHKVYEAGESVKYAGLPSENLSPTCEVGKQRAAEYAEQNAARVRALVGANTATPGLENQLTEFRSEILAAQAEMTTLLAGFVGALAKKKAE